MNIFYIHSCPYQCAIQHGDKHVVKMIVEYCQLMSTAHRVLDGEKVYEISKGGRKIARWRLDDNRVSLYKATHVNHPSSVWVRQSRQNYLWLHELTCALVDEYKYRWFKTAHASESVLAMLKQVPLNVGHSAFTPPSLAMPDEYKSDSHLMSYRHFYSIEKSHLHTWTRRPTPEWIGDWQQ